MKRALAPAEPNVYSRKRQNRNSRSSGAQCLAMTRYQSNVSLLWSEE
jgi:hypothetical protein